MSEIDVEYGIDQGPLLSRDQASEVFERLRSVTGRLYEDLAEISLLVERAYKGQAWIALGYQSWDECVADQLSDVRIWRNVDERHERVAQFRKLGLSTRAIGAVLGIHHTTVLADSKTLLAGGNPPTNNSTEGFDGKLYPVIRAVPAEVLARQVQVEILTKQNVAQSEIARQLGVTQGRVSQMRSEFRARVAALEEEDEQRVFALLESDSVPTVEVVARTLGVELSAAVAVEEQVVRALVALVDEVRVSARAFHEHGVYGTDRIALDPVVRVQAAEAVAGKLAEAISLLAQAARALPLGGLDEGIVLRCVQELHKSIPTLHEWLTTAGALSGLEGSG